MTCLWLLGTLGGALAEGPGDEGLDDLLQLLDQAQVSTASLTTQSVSTAPATSWTITAEQLNAFGIETLGEALNYLSMGMQVEEKFDYAELGARGVLVTGDYGTHVLLLIDGHTINEQWAGVSYTDRAFAFPVELIDHIEVVLGPGSVLYGSHAMLGVINVVTKTPRALDAGYLVVESHGPSSIRGSGGAGREFSVGARKLGLLVGMELYEQQGPSVTLGPQDYGEDWVTGEPRRFTDSEEGTGIWGGQVDEGRFSEVADGYARLGLGNLELDLRAATATRGTPYTVYGNFDDPDSWERDRWLSGDLRYRRGLSEKVSIDTRLYADAYDYFQNLPTRAAENCLDGQLEGCTYLLAGSAEWVGMDAHLGLDWMPGGKLFTLIGVDGRHRWIASDERYADYLSGDDVVTSDYALTENALGAFLEQTARPVSWLGLNAGARLDLDQRFGVHVSPRATVAAEAWNGGVLKLIYSEAFRAPGVFERYYADPTWWVAASQLGPEVVRSGEVCVEQRAGAQRLVGGVFVSQWSDLVSERRLGDDEIADAIAAGDLEEGVDLAYTYMNRGSSLNYGGNLGYEGSLWGRRLRPGFSVTVADWMTGSHGVYSGPGEEVVAPKVFGNAHVSLHLSEAAPVVGLAARVVGPRLVDYSEFEPYPIAPALAELRATLTGPVPLVDGLSYRLSGSMATTQVGPYSVGPLYGPTDSYAEQETAPIERFSGLVGLEWRAPLRRSGGR